MQVKVKANSASQLVVSANRLRDGSVTWLAKEGRWVDTLAEAHVFGGAEADAAMAQAARAEAEQVVVGAYLLDVTVTPAGIVPLRARERFRAGGPSFPLPTAA